MPIKSVQSKLDYVSYQFVDNSNQSKETIHLPPEMLDHILSFLPVSGSVRLTCKRWKQIKLKDFDGSVHPNAETLTVDNLIQEGYKLFAIALAKERKINNHDLISLICKERDLSYILHYCFELHLPLYFQSKSVNHYMDVRTIDVNVRDTKLYCFTSTPFEFGKSIQKWMNKITYNQSSEKLSLASSFLVKSLISSFKNFDFLEEFFNYRKFLEIVSDWPFEWSQAVLRKMQKEMQESVFESVKSKQDKSNKVQMLQMVFISLLISLQLTSEDKEEITNNLEIRLAELQPFDLFSLYQEISLEDKSEKKLIKFLLSEPLKYEFFKFYIKLICQQSLPQFYQVVQNREKILRDLEIDKKSHFNEISKWVLEVFKDFGAILNRNSTKFQEWINFLIPISLLSDSNENKKWFLDTLKSIYSHRSFNIKQFLDQVQNEGTLWQKDYFFNLLIDQKDSKHAQLLINDTSNFNNSSEALDKLKAYEKQALMSIARDDSSVANDFFEDELDMDENESVDEDYENEDIEADNSDSNEV